MIFVCTVLITLSILMLISFVIIWKSENKEDVSFAFAILIMCLFAIPAIHISYKNGVLDDM